MRILELRTLLKRAVRLGERPPAIGEGEAEPREDPPLTSHRYRLPALLLPGVRKSLKISPAPGPTSTLKWSSFPKAGHAQ